jgi:D-beta-D-heptose 7-phosphate kinase/D-beta-D-heptose 1-phosphate adenosyltransferase
MRLNFSSKKILVVGDFMIDHYIFGTSNRKSPESPVPVVVPEEEICSPGGAGNVAINLSDLGFNVSCLGAVGNDFQGKKLLSLLSSKNIDITHLRAYDNYTTTLKRRIFSNGKQVLRIDKEDHFNYIVTSPEDIDQYDACIISDYNKGVVKSCNIENKLIVVDPKSANFSKYKGAHIITPNAKELYEASTFEKMKHLSDKDFCFYLIEKYNFQFIVAKRSEKGLVLYGKNKFFEEIDAHKVSEADVTGAGDTVISALTFGYLLTKDIIKACKFANYAASIVVSKKGTNSVTLDEFDGALIESF